MNMVQQQLKEALKETGYLVGEGIKFKNKQHEFDLTLAHIDEKLSTSVELLRELKEKLKNCKV